MTLAEELESLIAKSIAEDSNPPRVIARLICRNVFALGFAAGTRWEKHSSVKPGKEAFEDGHWLAGYALEEPSKLGEQHT